MIRSFVFRNGKRLEQDVTEDTLRLLLYEEDVHLWVDLEAPTEEESRRILEGVFQFHPLAIEDSLAVTELPKADEYENCLFLVIHAVDYTSHEFKTTEMDFFIGRNFLVTFHRDPLRSVQSTLHRIATNSVGVARAPDRLAYTLLEFLLENYTPALDDLSNDMLSLEHDVLQAREADFFNRFLQLKQEVRRLRQIVARQLEVLSRIAHGEFRIVRSHLLPYYRDLQDRLVRLQDTADNYRDSLNGLMQIHLSLQQAQVNQVIKVLTVLATLALPIVAVTSFYGMNINHFPPTFEGRDSTWGWVPAYLYIFGLTGLLMGLTFWYLKRKKWT